ncbi:DUF3617 domain-containing protein [Thermodesulfobacteriota bacterium]
MLKKIFIVSILFITMAALPAWGIDLNPGKYEITVKTQISGTPQQMPPQTSIQCMTGEDPVPNSSSGSQGCKITDMKTEGNTVTYTMECDQQGMKTVTTGEMTYSGDTFEGHSESKMGKAAGGMVIKSEIKGKRIGDCDK